MRCLSADPITDVYDISYWQPWCPQFADGVDYVFFDISVLCGPPRAARWLQEALGVAIDGHIGVITLTALKAANPRNVVVTMSELRASNYNGLVTENPKLTKYLKGWLARTARVQADALNMLDVPVLVALNTPEAKRPVAV